MKRTLSAAALGGAFLLSACSGTGTTPPQPTASDTETTAPSADPSQTSPSAEAPLKPVYEVGGAYLEIPEDWSYDTDACKGDCPEGDHVEIYNADKERVLTLIPNTATSTDGDLNLYQRKVLKRTELPDQKIPGLDYIPTSVNTEYWEAENQEDHSKTSGLSIAVVDDEILDNSGEEPELYYFKLNDQNWPMFYVDVSYLDQRIGKNPSHEAAEEFVASDEFALIERVMLTVRAAEG